MKAVIFEEFGGPLRVAEVADPTVTDEGVIIKVVASGICRSDWHGWMGHDPDIRRFPHVPGHELAGTVEQIGGEVKGWNTGDRVTVPFVCACGACPECESGNHQICDHQTQPGFTHWGSFAEYVRIDHADVNLVALPEDDGLCDRRQPRLQVRHLVPGGSSRRAGSRKGSGSRSTGAAVWVCRR